MNLHSSEEYFLAQPEEARIYFAIYDSWNKNRQDTCLEYGDFSDYSLEQLSAGFHQFMEKADRLFAKSEESVNKANEFLGRSIWHALGTYFILATASRGAATFLLGIFFAAYFLWSAWAGVAIVWLATIILALRKRAVIRASAEQLEVARDLIAEFRRVFEEERSQLLEFVKKYDDDKKSHLKSS